MKVWRGITLTIWTIVLAFCFAVILFYYTLSTTVLNAATAKRQLANSAAYDSFRDTIVTDKIAGVLAERYPSNKLIDSDILRSTLAEAFPKPELQKELEPTIDSIYSWLDSKSPDPTFDIPLANKQEQFYRSLEVNLAKKIAALPECASYSYPPTDALINQACLPNYLTADQATRGVMDAIQSDQSLFTSSTNTDTFTLPVAESPYVRSIPTYLNYLWTLNLISIAVGLILIMLLLITRRLSGLTAIALGTILGSISLLLLVPLVKRALVNTQGDQFIAALASALLPPFTDQLSLFSLIGILAGIILAAAVTGIKLLKRRRTHA